jgi:hypothetical protein
MKPVKKKEEQVFIVNKQKIMWTCQESKKINKFFLNKIHKKFKLNIDCHDNSCRNHNFFQG